MKTINLEILTPYAKYFSGEVEYIEVLSEKYRLGIYPEHTRLITTVVVSHILLKINGEIIKYATSGGVMYIKENNEVTLLLESIEKSDEIDLERAIKAKERAEQRLNHIDDTIDVTRAQAALSRALNRINIFEK